MVAPNFLPPPEPPTLLESICMVQFDRLLNGETDALPDWAVDKLLDDIELGGESGGA